MDIPTPGVTVIVPAHNAEGTLPDCLSALARMTYRPAEIIVFADGATDRTVEIAEASGAKVMLNDGRPHGPAHGRNRAARETNSDLLLFVDSDVVIAEDCLEKLVAELQEHDAAAAFGSYDSQPGARRLAGLYANLRHHFVHQNSAREATTFWSGVGLIDRQVFLDIGGYDEDFAHPSIEDVELGTRLKSAGHRIRLVPEAQAKHCKDWTLWRVWHTDVVRRALPWSRLLVEGKSDGADLNLSSSERVKALASLGTFAALVAALIEPWALLAALGFLALYLYLSRRFIGVLAENLTPGQALRATLLHLCYHTYSLGAYLWVAAGQAFSTAFGPAPGGGDGGTVDGGTVDGASGTARFDRAFLLCLAVLTLLFSWALLLHGKPAYFDDTAAYLSGGEKIFAKLFSVLGSGATGVPAGELGAAVAAGGGEDGPAVIRSIPYYVMTYALSAPGGSLLLLALFQAAVAAFYVVLHCRVEGLRALPTIGIGAMLALVTPVALIAAFTVPDIFTVPIIGGIALLATRFDRIAPGLRIALVLLTGLGISAHLSFPPLAVVMTGAALLWLAWSHRAAIHGAFPAALLAGLPLVLGVSATTAGGLIGFGEVSVAPKRLPLVLARSLSDGPARWYLQERCATERYAICEVFPDGKAPRGFGPIMFGEQGILRTATDEQLERIRAEEAEIVLGAARAYPMFQVRKTVSSIGKQFVTFRPIEINFDRRFYRAEDGTLRTSQVPIEHAWPITAVDALAHLFIPLATLMLLVTLPLMPRAKLPIVLLAIIGIVANVAICAAFSGVAARYAMRALWMVPLLAALYSFAPLRSAVAGLARTTRGGGARTAASAAE